MKVRFHLPDFVKQYRLNMLMVQAVKMKPEYFREGIEIASVYGEFPTSLWNGGRSIGGECEPDFIKEVIKRFNSKGIPLRFTYTNPLLKEERLSDKYCNECLEWAGNGLNEVIVVSPLLEDYIRKNYPQYKITSSTCKQIENMDDLNAELEKDYNLVVLDYNWNNRFDELETIKHKDKCELLVNACCTPHCARRKAHYEHIAQGHIDYDLYKKSGGKEGRIPDEFQCEQMKLCIYEINQYETHISPDDIYEKYVPMGFTNFKIEGRSANTIQLLETYMYYMAKPEMRDIARLDILMKLTRGMKL